MRLRIETTMGMKPGPRGPEQDLITGRHVKVVCASAGPNYGRELEGVVSVTWHCGGRKKPAVCVLKLVGVEIDALVDLPPEAAAALRLIEGDE